LTDVVNGVYPEWKVKANITIAIVGLVFIYINQFINILIIHIQLGRDYKIEIYGWSLFCNRGKVKAQRAEVTSVLETDENGKVSMKKKGMTTAYESVRSHRGSLVENQSD